MTDLPVREAGVLNAQVTSDVHLACRAEIEKFKVVRDDLNKAIDNHLSYESQQHVEIKRLRAALEKAARWLPREASDWDAVQEVLANAKDG